MDDEESTDPWQFRPKAGCRYLRVRANSARRSQSNGDMFFDIQPMDQDRHQCVPTHRSSFFHVACSERGHLGERRVRIGRGGRYEDLQHSSRSTMMTNKNSVLYT